MRYAMTGLLTAVLSMYGCSDDDREAIDAAIVPDASLDAGHDSAAGDAGPQRDDDFQNNRAIAQLVGKSGTMVTGSAQFTLINGKVTMTLSVAGAEPGSHGAHLHAIGDCSADNASSAGGHWNPDMHPHGSGLLDAGTVSHLGDLGNIIIGTDKTGDLTFSNPEWTLSDGSKTDVVGKAVVIHRNMDDLITQEQADAGITPGNSDGRIACGVILK